MVKFRDYQGDAIEAGITYINSSSTRPSMIVGPTACHERGYKVYTYGGELVNVEDVKIGDKLMGPDSTERLVLKTTNGSDILYKITLRNGISFKVNGDHILKLFRTGEGSKRYYDKTYPKEVEVTVKDYLQWAKSRKHLYKIKRSGFHKPEGVEDLKLDPYYLGLWLGDGTSTSPDITNAEPEVKDYLKDLCNKCDLLFVQDVGSIHMRFVKKIGGGKSNCLRSALRFYGILGDKDIPLAYHTASDKTKIKLLEGIIDSDGYYEKRKGYYEITFKSKKLASSLYKLCVSLDLKPSINTKTGVCSNCADKKEGIYYRVIFRQDTRLNPLVERKKPIKRDFNTDNSLYSFKVEEKGGGEYFGFTLDKDHLYLDEHGIIQHNCGKSWIIAGIADRYDEPILVLQPSIELLKQNYEKYTLMGGEASIFSASIDKQIGHVTYATLDSVKKHAKKFKELGVKLVLIDECHFKYSPEPGSMFRTFMKELNPKKVIGLTATPFRLKNNRQGSRLVLLNRMRPGYFRDFIHVTQISEMLERGYWSPSVDEKWEMDDGELRLNSSGAEFTDASIQAYVEANGINNKIYLRILDAIHEGRKHILVFADSVASCETFVKHLDRVDGVTSAYLTAKTPKKQRRELIEKFKSGEIQVMFNFGILSTGFDFPELDAIIMGRPTNSLAVFYQIYGRGARIHDGKKDFLFTDYGNNFQRLAHPRDITIEYFANHGWAVFCGDRLVTNVILGSDPIYKSELTQGVTLSQDVRDEFFTFGKHAGEMIVDVAKREPGYIMWFLEKTQAQPAFKDRLRQALKYAQLQKTSA